MEGLLLSGTWREYAMLRGWRTHLPAPGTTTYDCTLPATSSQYLWGNLIGGAVEEHCIKTSSILGTSGEKAAATAKLITCNYLARTSQGSIGRPRRISYANLIIVHHQQMRLCRMICYMRVRIERQSGSQKGEKKGSAAPVQRPGQPGDIHVDPCYG